VFLRVLIAGAPATWALYLAAHPAWRWLQKGILDACQRQIQMLATSFREGRVDETNRWDLRGFWFMALERLRGNDSGISRYYGSTMSTYPQIKGAGSDHGDEAGAYVVS